MLLSIKLKIVYFKKIYFKKKGGPTCTGGRRAGRGGGGEEEKEKMAALGPEETRVPVFLEETIKVILEKLIFQKVLIISSKSSKSSQTEFCCRMTTFTPEHVGFSFHEGWHKGWSCNHDTAFLCQVQSTRL